MEPWYWVLISLLSGITVFFCRFGALFLPRVRPQVFFILNVIFFNTEFQIMQVKQVPTISREGALLITNRKISMFATVICTMIIALFQLVTALIGMAEKNLRPLSVDPDLTNRF